MKCFVCDAGTLNRQPAEVAGDIKNKKYTVRTMALVCDNCGHIAMEGEDTPEFMRKLADAYRRDHKLLTSDEIRKIRGSLSQQKFAVELGVGIASVKRWELGLVQDRSSNRLILEFARERSQTWSYEVASCHATVGSEGLALTATTGLTGRANPPPFCFSVQSSSHMPVN